MSLAPAQMNRLDLLPFLINPLGHKGAYFAALSLVTEPSFNKKSRITKAPTPESFSKIRRLATWNIWQWK